jgi:hypothetical protein
MAQKPKTNRTRHDWTDLETLELLDALENKGMTRAKAAVFLSEKFGRKVTFGAAVGQAHRVLKEADAVECLCQKPNNKNGGMPTRWWAS